MDTEYENSRFSKFTTITTSLTECTRTVRRARPDRMRSPALAFGGWPGWLLPPGGLPGPRCNFRVWRRPVAPVAPVAPSRAFSFSESSHRVMVKQWGGGDDEVARGFG